MENKEVLKEEKMQWKERKEGRMEGVQCDA